MGVQARRQREREQRRNQILDAARQVLFREGLAGASMNKIAVAAEVSVGTLYVYFQNKEELFAALQEEGLDILHEMIRCADAKGADPRERLTLMALAYLDFARRHRKYFDVYNVFLTSPEVSFPNELKQRIDTHGDRILSVVEGAIRDWASGDENVLAQSHQCALVFWSTLHGMLQFRKLRDTILAGQELRELYIYGVECLLRSFAPCH
ncbi:MAG: TetR/AcrR family transcriptional regulator [Candidatus Lernaella stagnicola]|nr:TetR/AcrR family transcriptional regulator [Candidatus Lernaella stagnicola]